MVYEVASYIEVESRAVSTESEPINILEYGNM
jgi:hypothetical protein